MDSYGIYSFLILQCIILMTFINGAEINSTNKTSCVLPEYHKHGKWSILSGAGKPGDRIGEGSILVNECDNGYTQIEETSYCYSGRWTESFECQRLCPPVHSTVSTVVKCTYKGGFRECDRAPDGSALSVSCSAFYQNSLNNVSSYFCVDGTWDYEIIRCSPICGVKKPSSFEGSGKYAWQAAIYIKKNETYKDFICAGTLISSNVILTAAHCITSFDDNTAENVEKYEVAVGNYYREYRHTRDVFAQVSKIKKFIVHESFKGIVQNYLSDLAMIVVETPFTLSEFIRPICLDFRDSLKLTPGKRGILVGWGYRGIANDYLSTTQKVVHIVYEDFTVCASLLPNDFKQFLTSDKICGRNYNSSVNVCKGDSGAGLFFENNGVYYLKGIASVQRQSIGVPCEPNQFTLYTNLFKYETFIIENLNKYSEEPLPTPETLPRISLPTSTSAPDKNSCVKPQSIQNGNWKLKYQVDLKNKNYYPPGTIIIGSCDDNYALENESNLSFCDEGTWTQVFSCKIKCPILEDKEYTTLTCTYNDQFRSCNQAIADTYLEVTCAPFYEVRNDDRYRICKSNGRWNDDIPQCVPACGIKNGQTSILAVGSTKANITDFPWQVAIFKKMKGEFSPWCGGSILTISIVLTAAHCMVEDKNDGTVEINKDIYEVAVGKYYRDYKHPDEENVQYSKIKRIITSEQYRGYFGNYVGDIALLVVEKKLILSRTVQPICLDISGFYQLRPNQPGIVSGWGFTKHGGDPPNELRQIEMPFVEESLCRNRLPPDYSQRYFSYDKICAGYINSSKAVCEGDSGGALIYRQSNGRYYVRGIVSISPRLQGSCDIDQYSLFTDVLKFKMLISRTILRYS
ncbi:uncharacterized protein LOC109609057 [Aethina tumida]|uniref:uncharacterized protein LOC109609057 n=1 Tax=Aethina tumida TaxID=116153 RepID=UPI00096B0C5B|nr:uncharacterized protein LOC109609057 [Aethina tumida]